MPACGRTQKKQNREKNEQFIKDKQAQAFLAEAEKIFAGENQ
jgi:hypothetical protein